MKNTGEHANGDGSQRRGFQVVRNGTTHQLETAASLQASRLVDAVPGVPLSAPLQSTRQDAAPTAGTIGPVTAAANGEPSALSQVVPAGEALQRQVVDRKEDEEAAPVAKQTGNNGDGVFPPDETATGGELDDKEPQVHVYRGITPDQEGWGHAFARGLTDFDHHMQMVFPGTVSLDTVFAKRIDHARKTGRNVVVVELGAGDGNLTREALSEPNSCPRSRRKLEGKSADTSVRFYSVTDAKTAQEHRQLSEFPEATLPGNEKIDAKEVRYSVTSSQDVKKLLKALGEKSADLVIASNFMQYMHPKLFEKVMQDVIDVLEPGGELRVFGYAVLAGKFLSVDDGYVPEDYPVVFKDPKKPEAKGVSAEDIRNWGNELVTNDQTTNEQFREAVHQIQDIMFASDYYSNPLLGHGIGNYRTYLRSTYNSLMKASSAREVFENLFKNILPIAEDQVRVDEMKVAKDKIIDDLKAKNADVALIERRRIPDKMQGLDAIVIKKRIEGKRIKKRDSVTSE